MSQRETAVGDRVFVSGSFGFESDWLAASGGRGGYNGRVVEFIPGRSDKPTAVVELDDELVLPSGVYGAEGREVHGRFLVLELAWVNHDWTKRPTRVLVELCDFRPDPKRWQDRRQGFYVESHSLTASSMSADSRYIPARSATAGFAVDPRGAEHRACGDTQQSKTGKRNLSRDGSAT